MGSDSLTVRGVQDAEVEGKTVLVRVDYNVPIRDGVITDDERIRASIPTLSWLLEHGAKVVLATHLGRPDGRPVPELRLDPVGARLAELMDHAVSKLNDCVGPAIEEAIAAGSAGDVFLLENVRFHHAEVENEGSFARGLARLADLFVNDAFATAHRAHASTFGVTDYLPAYAGLLIQREVEALSPLTREPERPYVAIIGGKKAQSKLAPLRDLLPQVDTVLLGGGVAFTFLHAAGVHTRDLDIDEKLLHEIKEIIRQAEELDVDIILPQDAVFAQDLEPGSETQIADVRSAPQGWTGFDIGPKAVLSFRDHIESARTVVWTGPMGVYEHASFGEGTKGVAAAIAASEAYSIVGGGETGDAVARFGYGNEVSYISTGGGACLAFLRGKSLPALDVLYA